MKSYKSIILCSLWYCLFASICFSDICPTWLEVLFPLIISAIDVLRLLYHWGKPWQWHVTWILLLFTLKKPTCVSSFSFSKCCYVVLSTGFHCGMMPYLRRRDQQRLNKSLLTRRYKHYFHCTNSDISLDTKSLWINVIETWLVCCWP